MYMYVLTGTITVKQKSFRQDPENIGPAPSQPCQQYHYGGRGGAGSNDGLFAGDDLHADSRIMVYKL